MILLPTTITINGTNYSDAGVVGVGVVVDEWGWDLDGDLEAAFHEEGPNMGHQVKPSFLPGQSVVISNGSGTNYFKGEIASVHPTFPDGWTFGYRCRGPKYQANLLAVTASDGTGTVMFNLNPLDDDYIPSLSGQTVGQILTYFLTLHATALTALGITTDATTTSQLAALTLVPPEPVYMQGWVSQAIDGVLRQWARNISQFIGPDGKMRFIDSTTLTDVTITEGTDTFQPFRFSCDVGDCWTRTVSRGKGDIAPFFASLTTGEITAAWSGAQQTAWSYPDYNAPADAYDTGSVITIGGPTSVTIKSTDVTVTHIANFWAARQAWIHLFKSGGTGITFTESRPVTASTAETAGSNFTVTLGFDLNNAGASAYDSYKLVGTANTLAGGGLVDVYRLFNITDTYIKAHLVKKFPKDVPFFGYYGESYANTSYPIAVIVDAQGLTYPASFKIIPQTGQIRFDEPVVKGINSLANLNLGGSHVTPPTDIYVMLAYSRGALEAVWPADIAGVPQYAGTAFTLFGIQRTRYIDIDSWIYAGNQGQMLDYAKMMQLAGQDAVFSGSIPILGPFTSAFTPGIRLNLTGTSYTTGQDTLKIPVRSFRLQYINDGKNGLLYVSTCGCSSLRNPATGERYYVHPTSIDQLGFKFPENMGGLDTSSASTATSQSVSDAANNSFAAPSDQNGDTSGLDSALGMGEGQRNPAGSSGFAGNLTEQGGFKANED